MIAAIGIAHQLGRAKAYEVTCRRDEQGVGIIIKSQIVTMSIMCLLHLTVQITFVRMVCCVPVCKLCYERTRIFCERVPIYSFKAGVQDLRRQLDF